MGAASLPGGPASNGRVRTASTCESRSLAISDTCDFDSRVMPRVSTSFSILRVLTPSRLAVATTLTSADSAAGAAAAATGTRWSSMNRNRTPAVSDEVSDELSDEGNC
jgi:hypothetical protein